MTPRRGPAVYICGGDDRPGPRGTDCPNALHDHPAAERVCGRIRDGVAAALQAMGQQEVPGLRALRMGATDMSEPTTTAAPDPHECFELDGARVHGDPNMSDESREALQEIIAATRQRAEQECCIGCGHMLASHGTAGCTARVSRHGTCQCGESS